MEQATNQFTKGLLMDTHPMVLSNDTLTDCLNGTLITMSGNEVVLLNDMGNRRVDNAFLPPGYEPVGMKEYGGIIYVAAYNPVTNHSQVGSFPSPERKLSPADAIDDLQASFDFGDFYKDENIEHDDVYGLDFLKNDSFLIPLTKDLNLHVGDKFTVYAAGLSEMESRITNYNNVIEIDGKKYPLTPKNREFTLQLGILNSQNEFVDITKSLVRWKQKDYISEDLIFSNEEIIKTIDVNSNSKISLELIPANDLELEPKLYYSINNGDSWVEVIINSPETIVIPENITKLKLKGKNIKVTSIKSINEWEIIDYTNESELYQFNDGYFIPDKFDIPDWELTIKDSELIQERQALPTNTYAYKLVGPLYLKVTLNHIQSCDYNIDINVDEDLNIILTNNSILYYNCPDGSNINLNSGLIGEYYTKDIPNFSEVKLKLNIFLNDFIITDPIEDYDHNCKLLNDNLILVESSRNEYLDIYRDTSGTFSENRLIIDEYVLVNNLLKSLLLIFTKEKELNKVVLKWGENLENEINLNFILISSKFYNIVEESKIIYHYVYNIELNNILNAEQFENENIKTLIIISSNEGFIKAIWFYPYYNFKEAFYHLFLKYRCFDNFKGNKYLFTSSYPNEISLYDFNGDFTTENNLEIINYNLEIIPEETKIVYFPENVRKSYLLELQYLDLYRVKNNSFVYKHTLEFNIDNCYEFLLKASSKLELISIKAFINEHNNIEILKDEDIKLLYNPPTYINEFSFKIDSNIQNIKIEYHSDSEKEFLQIFPKLKNTLNLLSRNILDITYDQEIYKAKLNDIYKIKNNYLNINLIIGTLFKNINETDIYLKGCTENLNINTEYINKNVIEIEDWRTYYENNKIQFMFGIKNYTGQSIENIKIYFLSYDKSHNYTFQINKTFNDWYNTTVNTININNNELKSNTIYKVNKITYNIVGQSDEREIIEYLKLVDNPDLYDLDINGNKKQLLRWIITTDLFNDFYSLDIIKDYCTLYNSSIELRLKFLDKMIVNFDFNQSKDLCINVVENLQNSDDPYSFTESIITFSNYPNIDENTLKNNVIFLKNYPEEVINSFKNKLNDAEIEVNKNYINIDNNYYGLNKNMDYYYKTISKDNFNNIVEQGNSDNLNLKKNLESQMFMYCRDGAATFLLLYLYYLGDHQSGSSRVINQYFDPISDIWENLGSSETNKYAVLIPDTHERGGDDYHYLITYLNNSKFGEIKSYNEIGKNNYEYLNSQIFNKELDAPVTFYYSEAQQLFSDYLNNKLPKYQIYTTMYIKGLKAYKNINGNYFNHYYFDPYGPCISYIRNKDDKWYIANKGNLTSYSKNFNHTYYCSHMTSGESSGTPYYKSNENYIYTKPIKCELLAKIKTKFISRESRELFSYGNLNFKLKNLTYYNYQKILLKNGDNIVEELGYGLHNTVNYSGQVIKQYVKDYITQEYTELTDINLDTTKLYYYLSNDNYHIVKNFYVYNDEEHKINGKNTFVYSFPEELTTIFDDLSKNKIDIEGNLYDGIEYCNDTDSITRLHFEGMVRNSEIEY